ncbi:MAG: hypothetical protein JWQ51_770 [Tardiphaga sp.]|nr:hypothetical protein [Tardiphaga sp.]
MQVVVRRNTVSTSEARPLPACGGGLRRGASPAHRRGYLPPGPSPGETAFTPVFDGLRGDGARGIRGDC